VTLPSYLDLQKAFDTVNHSVLLKKLENYRIRGMVLNWFKSYLNSRKQCTSLLTYMSDLESVKYCVPQGSVLGPLLFLIYVKDIQYVVKDSKIKLFADDTNLSLYNTHLDKLFEIANMNMSQLSDWFTLNLNLDKTCYCIIVHVHFALIV